MFHFTVVLCTAIKLLISAFCSRTDQFRKSVTYITESGGEAVRLATASCQFYGGKLYI